MDRKYSKYSRERFHKRTDQYPWFPWPSGRSGRAGSESWHGILGRGLQNRDLPSRGHSRPPPEKRKVLRKLVNEKIRDIKK